MIHTLMTKCPHCGKDTQKTKSYVGSDGWKVICTHCNKSFKLKDKEGK